MKKIILLSSLAAMLYGAQSTMCFKQNWAFLADIESTPLDGGECKGAKSVDRMKKEGWSIADIKVTSAKMGMDYLYIFKKDEGVIAEASNNTTKKTENIVVTQQNNGAIVITDELLKQIAIKKEEADKKAKEAKLLASGEKMYKQSCANCHGAKGESTAYHTSKALNTMSEEDIVFAIRGYNLNDYDKGMAYLMAPYANFMTKEDALGVSRYLQSINK